MSSAAPGYIVKLRGGIQGLQGNPGPTGPSGNSVLSGVGSPTDDFGVNGDFYVDTASYNFFGPKIDGAWGDPISLVGPQGPPFAGAKRFLAASYAVQAGDGILFMDMRSSSLELTLPSLVSDVDVTVKDFFGAVDGIDTVLTVNGTLDGVLNPTMPLIAVQFGWARLSYTQSHDAWSLIG